MVQTKKKSAKDRYFIRSLARGLDILEAFTDDVRDLSLGELARHVKLAKPTTFRLVHTMVKSGYLRQNQETRRFALAPRALALGYAYFDSMDLKRVAAPSLNQLAHTCGLTVNMAVLDRYELVYVERIKTTQVVNINLHVGSRLPLYNTSMGRALIAYKPESWVRDYVAGLAGNPDARVYVKSGARRLYEILSETRRQGYAVNNQDLAPGLLSIACPVWDAGNEVAAAVNIAAPTVQVSLAQMKKVHTRTLLQTAREISAALGHRESQRQIMGEKRRVGGL